MSKGRCRRCGETQVGDYLCSACLSELSTEEQTPEPPPRYPQAGVGRSSKMGDKTMEPTLTLCENANLDQARKRGWIYERKLDGIRVLAMEGRLFNRDRGTNKVGNDITRNFPELDLPQNCVLDGELCSKNGVGDVTGRALLEDEFRCKLRARKNPATLWLFDVLYWEGEDLRNYPLTERKDYLQRLSLEENIHIKVLLFYRDADRLWESVLENGDEGLVAKDPDSPYVGKRTDRWLKVKAWKEERFEVQDYGRTDEGGFVIHILPSPDADRTQKIVVNEASEQEKIKDKFDGGLEAKVRFLERTDSGRLRHISYEGVR